MSENAFVFPAMTKADVMRLLGALAHAQPGQWVAPGPVFVWLVEEDRHLYVDWEAHMVAMLDRAVDQRPTWAVQVNYRVSRREEMVALTRALLQSGGVAVDDFVEHIWTAEEIMTDALVRARRFGEPPLR
ncbi:hypothetical protein ACIBTV_06985 [Micromonospora sp. NPDC049366]|uniref:hypothetical protein n=1 Tax=Micromonospora sp. NPDC049366 TaxID=3364271 RepID=UPI0037ABA72A